VIELIWSGRARRDVAGIVGRLHSFSPSAADEFESLLFQAIHELKSLPGLGHRRADLTQKNVLFYRIPPHVIVFGRTKGRITISRVLHSARDLGNLI
jgi:plasmid stabilization system protein ParE